MRSLDQRPPLPAGLTDAERAFFTELRRQTAMARLSCRSLEGVTASARSAASAPCFYSKSQWARWLNGTSTPPRQAICKLAELLAAGGADSARLVELWDRAFGSGPSVARSWAARTLEEIARSFTVAPAGTAGETGPG